MPKGQSITLKVSQPRRSTEIVLRLLGAILAEEVLQRVPGRADASLEVVPADRPQLDALVGEQ